MSRSSAVIWKATASILVFTFTWTQVLWAADPREMLASAKRGFESQQNTRRGGGMSPGDLTSGQSQAQFAAQGQNDLQDLENLNFSLTTKNGDLLKYVGQTLKEVIRPDGTLLNNLTVGTGGNITDSDLKLPDGSIQIYRDGKVIGYETPSGTQVIYNSDTSRIEKTIAKDGKETVYSYVTDADGNVTQTILESPTHRSVYDAEGKLKEVLQKSDNTRMIYSGGLIHKILKADGSQFVFKQEVVDGDIHVTFEKYVDQNGLEFVYDHVLQEFSKVRWPDGSFLKDASWKSDGSFASGTLVQDNLEFIYKLEDNAALLKEIKYGDGAILNLVWIGNEFSEALLTESGGTQSFYNAQKVVTKITTPTALIQNILWDASRHLESGHILKDGVTYVVENYTVTGLVWASGERAQVNRWTSDGKIDEAYFTDLEGNVFHYLNQEVPDAVLNGKILTKAQWTASGAFKSGELLLPNGITLIYDNGELAQTRLAGGTLISGMVFQPDGALKDFVLVETGALIHILQVSESGQITAAEIDHQNRRFLWQDGHVRKVFLANGDTVEISAWNEDGTAREFTYLTASQDRYYYLVDHIDSFTLADGSRGEGVRFLNGAITDMVFTASDRQTVYTLQDSILTQVRHGGFIFRELVFNADGDITSLSAQDALGNNFYFTKDRGFHEALLANGKRLKDVLWGSDQRLSRATLVDGELIYEFDNGAIYEVRSPDWTLGGIELSSDGIIARAIFTNSFQTVYQILNGEVSSITLADLSILDNLIYENGILTGGRLTLPSGVQFSLNNGEIDGILKEGIRYTGVTWTPQGAIDIAVKHDVDKTVFYKLNLVDKVYFQDGSILSHLSFNADWTTRSGQIQDPLDNLYLIASDEIIIHASNGQILSGIVWNNENKIQDADIEDVSHNILHIRGGALTQVTLANGKGLLIVTRTDSDGRLFDFTWELPDGKRLIYLNGSIDSYERNNKTYTALGFNPAGRLIRYSLNGNTWTLNDDGSVNRVALADGDAISNVTRLGSQGELLDFTLTHNDEVILYQNNQPIQITKNNQVYTALGFNPADRLIRYTLNGNAWTLSDDGSVSRVALQNGDIITGITRINSQGQLLDFTLTHNDEVILYQNNQPIQITKNNQIYTALGFNPAGRLIRYTLNGNAWTLSDDGSINRVTLANGDGISSVTRLGSQGELLDFTLTHEDEVILYRNNQPIQITKNGESYTNLGFNPTGKLISYILNGNTWTINDDGSVNRVALAGGDAISNVTRLGSQGELLDFTLTHGDETILYQNNQPIRITKNNKTYTNLGFTSGILTSYALNGDVWVLNQNGTINRVIRANGQIITNVTRLDSQGRLLDFTLIDGDETILYQNNQPIRITKNNKTYTNLGFTSGILTSYTVDGNNWLLNQDSTVNSVTLANGDLINNVTRLGPQGELLDFTLTRNSEVILYQNNQPIQITKTGEIYASLGFNPAGRLIRYTLNANVWTLNDDGSVNRVTLQNGDVITGVTRISFQGQLLDFTLTHNDEVILYQNNQPIQITKNNQVYTALGFNPAGKLIRYTLNGNVWTLNDNGSINRITLANGDVISNVTKLGPQGEILSADRILLNGDSYHYEDSQIKSLIQAGIRYDNIVWEAAAQTKMKDAKVTFPTGDVYIYQNKNLIESTVQGRKTLYTYTPDNKLSKAEVAAEQRATYYNSTGFAQYEKVGSAYFVYEYQPQAASWIVNKRQVVNANMIVKIQGDAPLNPNKEPSIKFDVDFADPYGRAQSVILTGQNNKPFTLTLKPGEVSRYSFPGSSGVIGTILDPSKAYTVEILCEKTGFDIFIYEKSAVKPTGPSTRINAVNWKPKFNIVSANSQVDIDPLGPDGRGSDGAFTYDTDLSYTQKIEATSVFYTEFVFERETGRKPDLFSFLLSQNGQDISFAYNKQNKWQIKRSERGKTKDAQPAATFNFVQGRTYAAEVLFEAQKAVLYVYEKGSVQKTRIGSIDAYLSPSQNTAISLHLDNARGKGPFFQTLEAGLPEGSYRAISLTDKGRFLQDSSITHQSLTGRQESLALAYSAVTFQKTPLSLTRTIIGFMKNDFSIEKNQIRYMQNNISLSHQKPGFAKPVFLLKKAEMSFRRTPFSLSRETLSIPQSPNLIHAPVEFISLNLSLVHARSSFIKSELDLIDAADLWIEEVLDFSPIRFLPSDLDVFFRRDLSFVLAPLDFTKPDLSSVESDPTGILDSLDFSYDNFNFSKPPAVPEMPSIPALPTELDYRDISLPFRQESSVFGHHIPAAMNFQKPVLDNTLPLLDYTYRVLPIFQQSLSVARPAQSLLDADIEFSSMVYHKDDKGNVTLKQAALKNQTTLIFENGELRQAQDKDGKVIAGFEFDESSLSNIVGSDIVQNGAVSHYDATGRLSLVDLKDEGTKIHYKAGSDAIDYIETADGAKVYDPVFDAAGNVVGAEIHTPEGEIRLYENGVLVELIRPDQTKLIYEAQKLKVMFTPQKLTYNFTYEPEEIRAELDPSIVPDALTTIQMHYDNNFNLKKAIRKNNEILSYLVDDKKNNLIEKIEAEGKEAQVFQYTKNADGKVTAYTVTQGSTETFYNADNQVEKSVISPSTDNPHTLLILYQYGKIREIKKDDVTTFNYTYTFDADGQEITHIEDLEEGSDKVYKGGLLLTDLTKETSVLSTYEYAEIASAPAAPRNDRVSKVTVTRLGRPLHVYDYAYSGDDTLVTDEEGVIRTYNKDKKLTFLQKENKKYAYTYTPPSTRTVTYKTAKVDADGKAVKDADGNIVEEEKTETIQEEETVHEELIEQTLKDGTMVQYEKGHPKRINLNDGSFITDITLDESRQIKSATLNLPDNSKKVFDREKLIEEITPDNTHYFFAEDKVSKVIESDGTELEYFYDKDDEGNVTAIWIKTGEGLLKYDPEGNLLGMKLEGQEALIEGGTDFTDSSGQKHLITARGEAHLTESGSVFGAGAAAFDGEGDYLALAGSPDWNLGPAGSGNDWTIDFWTKRNGGSLQYLLGTFDNSDGWNLFYNDGVWELRDEGTTNAGPRAVLTVGSWYHVALVKSGAKITLYLNGKAAGNFASDFNMNNDGNALQIGARGDGSLPWNGQLDELRISKGIARWTSNFSAPTQAHTADAYTKLLLHFDDDRSFFTFNKETNTFENARSKFQFDQDGKYLSGTFSPPAVIKNFMDASKRHTISAKRGPSIDPAIFKIGTGSGLFKGTGDPTGSEPALVIGDSPDWDFGTGDFTVETWVNFKTLGQNVMLFSRNRDSGQGDWEFMVGNWGTRAIFAFNVAVEQRIDYNFQTGAWYHLAWVRKDGTLYTYINGVDQANHRSSPGDIKGSSEPVHIGADDHGNWGLDGFMDEARISNTARYAGNFSPSTDAFETDDKTKLLLHFDDEDKISFDKAKTVFQSVPPKLITLAKDPFFQKMNFTKDFGGNVKGQYAFGRLKHVTESDVLKKTYTTTKDIHGSPITWVDNGRVKLKYDAQGKLLGMKVKDLQGADEARATTTHTYEGGTGSLSVDGNYDTAQSAASQRDFDRTQGSTQVRVASIHTFQSPQTVTQLAFSAWGGGSGHGDYGGGGGGGYSIEYQLSDGQWVVFSEGRSSGKVIKDVNLSGVMAVRAVAHGNGHGSDHGSCDAYAYIYEIQYALADQANFDFIEEVDSQGKVTGYSFKGQVATIRYDDKGALLAGTPGGLIEAAQSLAGELPQAKNVPYPDRISALKPLELAGWVSTTSQSILDSQTVAIQEYTSSGVMETQTKADQTVTVFENNKPAKVYDDKGALLMEYTYDAQGHPSKVYLKNARDTLPDEIQRAKQKIEEERVKSLEELARQKDHAVDSVRKEIQTNREQLQGILNNLQTNYSGVASIRVKGKKGKSQRGDALNSIGHAMDDVRGAIAALDNQERKILEQLDTQVKELSDRIESDSQRAFSELAKQEINLKKEILRQEISPIVYDYYRRILGRDPDSKEYDSWIAKIDYDTGKFITGYDENTEFKPGASMAFDGSGDYLTVPQSSDFDFGTDDFTMEAWVNLNTTDSKTIAAKDSNPGGWIFLVGTTDLGLYSDYNSPKWVNPSLSLNRWYHVAVSRSGNSLRFFVDGVQQGPTFDVSGTAYDGPANELYVGTYNHGSSGNFNGLMDEVHISKGVGRYTQNFIPQDSETIPDSNTKLLLRIDTSSGAIKDLSEANRPVTVKGNASVNTDKYKVQRKEVTRTPILVEVTKTLKDHINALPELVERTAYVNNIKSKVKTKINDYLAMSTSDKEVFASSLGLPASDLIGLTDSDAQKIIKWLDSRTLHFGQSAFLSLENLLDQKGISYAREDIAEKAIVIDILSGVITPLDDGDLVISVFSLNKVASLYGLSLSGANLNWDDLKNVISTPTQSGEKSRVIAHINGNHFVVITGITDDSITYIDTGAGKDKDNESLTISKEQFLKVWKGNVTAESVILSERQRVEGSTVKLLSAEQTKQIRGAFFFLLFIAVFQAVGAVIAAVGAVIAQIAAIVGQIAALVGQVIVNIGTFLGNVLHGIGTALYNVVHFAASSLYQAVGQIGTFLSQNVFGSFVKASFGHALFKTAVTIGINFAVSKGLESLGVNPIITGIVAAIVTGGLNGLMTPLSATQLATGVTQAQVIGASIFKSVVLESVGQLSMHLGLDAGFMNVIGLSLAAIGGQFIDGSAGSLAKAFSNIKSQLFSSLALWGVEKLGTKLGLDPRLSTLIASPISNLVNASFNNGFDFGRDAVTFINRGLVGGFVSLGMETALDKLDAPVFARNFVADILNYSDPDGGPTVGEALISRLGDGMLRFGQGAFKAVGTVLSFGTRALQGAASITADGFKNAVRAVSNIFNRKTVEGIYRDQANLQGGTLVKDGSEWRYDVGGSIITYDTQTDTLREWYGDGNATFTGFASDDAGNAYYQKLTYRSTGADGLILEQNFENGHLSDWAYYDGNAPIFKVDLNDPESGVKDGFSDSGSIELYAPINIPGPTVEPGSNPQTYNVPFRMRFEFKNGKITKTDVDVTRGSAQEEDPGLDKELFVLANGLLNDKTKKEGAPEYLLNLKEDVINQSDSKIKERDIITASTFYTSPLIQALLDKGEVAGKTTLAGVVLKVLGGEVIKKLANSGKDVLALLAEVADPNAAGWLADEIKQSVEGYFSLYGQANRLRDMVAVGYSGGFMPLVETLARKVYNVATNTGYKVKTLVGLGAATFNPEQLFKDLLVKIVEAADYLSHWENVSKNAMEEMLRSLDGGLFQAAGVRFGEEVIKDIMDFFGQGTPDKAYKKYEETLQGFHDALSRAFKGDVLENLTNTGTKLIVNVYGTNDILSHIKVNDKTLGGYRDDIAGFTANDRNHALVNVEIVGASHFDYMRREAGDLLNFFSPKDKEWNKTVGAFVADLVANSQDAESLDRFMRNPAPKHRAQIIENAGKWEVRLPGYDEHA